MLHQISKYNNEHMLIIIILLLLLNVKNLLVYLFENGDMVA